MSSLVEYNLSELGPWEAVGGDEATASVWVSPDPHHAGFDIYYSEKSGGMYVTGACDPICFEGNLYRPGFPRPEEAAGAAVGTPREQWEHSLSSEE